jgi:hypothetical protein
MLVVLCTLGSPTLRGEGLLPFDKLIALEGKEFVTAAETSGYETLGGDQAYTVDQLIAVAEKLLPSVKPYGERPDDYSLSPFSFYFEPACEKADDKQLDKLIELYRRLDPNTFEKSSVLPELGSRVLVREIAGIPVQHLKIPEDATITAPPELESSAKELQDAWRLFQSTQGSFNRASPKSTERSEQIEVSANTKSFYSLISDVLSGATGKEDEVRAFAWTGANCLDITDTEDAQDIALLLMLLREGRMSEAIGASLKVSGPTGSTSKPESYAKPVSALLERCGVDWEEVFAGGQVEQEMKEWGRERRPYLAALVRYGSPRAAALVRSLAHFAKPQNRTPYVGAFSGWIETSVKRASCADTEISLNLGITGSDDRVVRAMPKTIQTAVLHDIEEFATSDCPEDLAMHAINAFVRTQVPSSIPALKALARHSSRKVATDAATILCAMGERIKIPELAGPVRFQILTNGKPLQQDLEIAWRLASEGGTTDSAATVLADGVIEIPREQFTLRDRPATSLGFKLYRLGEDGVIFETQLSAPWSFDDLTKVDVKVSSLEIVLQNRDGLNAPPPDKAFLGLRRLPDDNSDDHQREVFSDTQTGSTLFREKSEIGATPSIRLAAVQKGKYQVWIGVPGAEIWRDTVVVGPTGTKVEAKLKPGSDLRFQIFAPNGQRVTWVSLLQNGEEVKAQRETTDREYRALPCGSYVLRIQPSDFFERERPELKTKRGPDQKPYKGRDISFTIEKGSPAVIDLGEIRLEAAD